jgi:putative ABC transport system substrate-binding protein
MQRREFITLLGSAALAWPLSGSAEQTGRIRHIGILMNLPADDPESSGRAAVFRKGLQELGWVDGQNVRLDYRWAAGDADRFRAYAAELVALAPDVILAASSPAVAALQQATHSIPVVFVQVIDPVGGGFVASLARPGGNVTGFTQFEYSIGGKWLDLLKESAPRLSRAAVLRDITIAAGSGQFGAIQGAAASRGVDVSPVDVRDPNEIERAVTTFARSPNGGLIVTASNLTTLHREQIITLAARNSLPAIYPYRYFATGGGFISYGPDMVDPFLQAASYIDRVLKGEKPADLPVQAPTKYEFVINLKTAKALGLTLPQSLIAIANEVIE